MLTYTSRSLKVRSIASRMMNAKTEKDLHALMSMATKAGVDHIVEDIYYSKLLTF